MNPDAPLRVMVVDDSAFMRKMVSDILQRAGIEVVTTARDGLEALEKRRQFQPDVITLDVEMPRMDGVTFLQKIMQECPTPVIMLSSRTDAGAEMTIRCLSLGAFDCLHKPSGAISLDIERIGAEIVAKVRAAGCAPRRCLYPARVPLPGRVEKPKGGGEARSFRGRLAPQEALVVIASSTGGPAALNQVVPHLPGDLPAAVLMVQHLPVGFTRSLAKRLDEESALTVREATEGETLQRGVALVAPGGYHMGLDGQRRITLNTDPPLWGVRPAADITLRMAAERFGSRVVGVILTGMGRDGALGAKAVHEHGGVCLAQDEATCVVYGMPRAACEAGGIDQSLPLHKIAEAIQAAVMSTVK